MWVVAAKERLSLVFIDVCPVDSQPLCVPPSEPTGDQAEMPVTGTFLTVTPEPWLVRPNKSHASWLEAGEVREG